jgi:hypothetical protein
MAITIILATLAAMLIIVGIVYRTIHIAHRKVDYFCRKAEAVMSTDVVTYLIYEDQVQASALIQEALKWVCDRETQERVDSTMTVYKDLFQAPLLKAEVKKDNTLDWSYMTDDFDYILWCARAGVLQDIKLKWVWKARKFMYVAKIQVGNLQTVWVKDSKIVATQVNKWNEPI